MVDFQKLKRGSLQLSIEAIIVLVIAMVLLGLGIAFIRGFFAQGTEKLTQPFDAIEFGCDPTAETPIKTIPSVISVKSGDALDVKMCVYSNIEANNVNLGFTKCTTNAQGAPANPLPQLLTTAQKIKRLGVGGFNTILTASTAGASAAALPQGTYICTLEAHEGQTAFATACTGTCAVVGSQQVTIKVI